MGKTDFSDLDGFGKSLRNFEKLTSARMLRETKFKMVVNEFQSNVVHNGFQLK